MNINPRFIFFAKISKPDLLLIDKPKGITSFDVIRILRRKINIRKIGHAGTLDPLASGLMILGINKGTKKLTNLIKLDKKYKSEIVLGEKRTTGDLEGEIIQFKDLTKQDLCNLKKNKTLEKTLKDMVGNLELPVPAFSAIKRGGQPLYKKARKGIEMDLPIKTMKVISAKIVKTKFNKKTQRIHVWVVFHVGSGTYIRSLVENFGERIGLPATLGNLRRTQVGDFSISKSYRI